MIEFEKVSRHYGSRTAVDDFSVSICKGEFFVLIGPSGSGKSTVLKMINRMVPHSEGVIRINGEDILAFRPEELRRRMGYVIQSIGLFPHWTVERNIGAVPELLAWPERRIRDRVSELLDLFNLEPERFRKKYPHQLSGGEQQRIGVARALAACPDILLMDEPFGALDPITRTTLQVEIARIHRESGTTIVFVTHDMDEALGLASRIAVLDRGRLAQVGTPLELLTTPATGLVSDLVGRDDHGLRLLAIETVASRVRTGESAGGDPIAASASLRQALSRMISEATERLAVVDAVGRPLGALLLSDLIRR